MPSELNNSEYRLLCIAGNSNIGVTAWDVFHAIYKSSEHPMRKVAGLYRSLRRLARHGLLWPGGGSCAFIYTEVRFTLSRNGREAALKEEAERQRLRRPTFPRMGFDGWKDSPVASLLPSPPIPNAGAAGERGA